jgi:CRISPR-associated protein Csd1
MILQALCDYYERKVAEDPQSIPPSGFEPKEIPFILEVAPNGALLQIEDTREIVGKRPVGRTFWVPQGPKKSVNIVASLLWGNAEYVLGIPDLQKLKQAGDQNKKNRYRERLGQMHEAFVDRIRTLPEPGNADAGVAAVLRFLDRLDITSLGHFRHWDEITAENPLVSFRLQGDRELVCQRESVRKAAVAGTDEHQTNGFCPVTGKFDEIARLHPPIKGVRNAQTSGANIVSFNLDAFNSYGKTQGGNASVGQSAAFAYATALNHLLARDSIQRLQVGDASTVFWSQRTTILETTIVDIFGEPTKDNPDRNIRAVRSLYEAPKTGILHDEGSTHFFVLGLAPNAARIAVRFWYGSTVAELATHIRQHFDDLEITRPEFEPRYFSLFRLLISTAALSKADKILPNLAGEVMRAILQGSPYPQSLLQAVILRIRAEHEITYVRAALIKACINRAGRFSRPDEKELTVALDENNLNAGYRLGRLFAVLERVQEEASPGINATIRDRFYGAASTTPVAVFSSLMKLKNHHLGKIESRGRVVYFEKLIGEIMSGINDFPSQLSLSDQGKFAVGYYQQRQAFFTKSQAAASV